MKSFKKFLLTAAAFFAAITITGGVKASAADYSINLNTDVTGQVHNYDENTYSFNAPAKGYFNIEVYFEGAVHDNGTKVTGSNVCLSVQMKSDYKNYWQSLNIGINKAKSVSPNYCFKPGQPVSLTVKGDFDKTTFDYKIKVVYVADKYFEKEDNNTANKATSLKRKKVYSGIITDGDDTDWFVFKAPKAGKYKFMAVNTEEIHGWTAFTPYKSKVKQDGTGYFSAYSGAGWKKIATVKLKKGQKYYIKVKKGYNDNATYKIKVK